MKKLFVLLIFYLLLTCCSLHYTDFSIGNKINLRIEKLYDVDLKDVSTHQRYSVFLASYNGKKELFLTNNQDIEDLIRKDLGDLYDEVTKSYIVLPIYPMRIVEKEKYDFEIKELMATNNLRVTLPYQGVGYNNNYNLKSGFISIIKDGKLISPKLYVIKNIYTVFISPNPSSKKPDSQTLFFQIYPSIFIPPVFDGIPLN